MSRSSQRDPVPLAKGSPVGSGAYKVTQGECLIQIAGDTGHFWETIWNDPENADLKKARKEPFLLLPGDKVFIPELQVKYEECLLDAHHRFRRKGVPAKIHLCFRTDGKPMANRDYRLVVDGAPVRRGTLDADGCLEEPVPTGARMAHIVIDDPDENIEYEIELGVLNPHEDRDGIVARLINLGYMSSDDADNDEAIARAIGFFQSDHGFESTGELDDATREKIVEEHGS